MSSDYIRALRVERDEYVSRGLKDRVAQVDAELSRLGVVIEKPPAARRTNKKTG